MLAPEGRRRHFGEGSAKADVSQAVTACVGAISPGAGGFGAASAAGSSAAWRGCSAASRAGVEVGAEKPPALCAAVPSAAPGGVATIAAAMDAAWARCGAGAAAAAGRHCCGRVGTPCGGGGEGRFCW